MDGEYEEPFLVLDQSRQYLLKDPYCPQDRIFYPQTFEEEVSINKGAVNYIQSVGNVNIGQLVDYDDEDTSCTPPSPGSDDCDFDFNTNFTDSSVASFPEVEVENKSLASTVYDEMISENETPALPIDLIEVQEFAEDCVASGSEDFININTQDYINCMETNATAQFGIGSNQFVTKLKHITLFISC